MVSSTRPGDGATPEFSGESMAGLLFEVFYDSAGQQTGLKKWLSALRTTAEER
jgi:hypothetical protein